MNILRRIERHMRRYQIPATRFGRQAANDPRLVHDLRRGRIVGAKLAARIEHCIIEQEARP
jgi:hypothetical protein